MVNLLRCWPHSTMQADPQIFVRASTKNILIILSFRFFVVSCMLSTYHVSPRIVISIYSILIPMDKHKWNIYSLWSKPGMGLLSQLPSFHYFQFFSNTMTQLSYCIRSHFKGVVAAQLQWHLPNMNVIKKIRYLICHIISGARHDKLGPHHHKSGPKHTYLGPHMISQGPHISRSRRDKWGTQHSRGSHIIILGPWHSKSGSSHDKSWFNIIISEP